MKNLPDKGRGTGKELEGEIQGLLCLREGARPLTTDLDPDFSLLGKDSTTNPRATQAG